MKIIKIFLIILSSISLIHCGSPDWKYCKGVAHPDIDISALSVEPFPIQKGQVVHFEITGTTHTAFSQEDLGLTVVKSGVPIYNTKMGGPYSAPQGNYDYLASYGLPGFIPSGDFTLEFKIKATDGSAKACVQFDVKF